MDITALDPTRRVSFHDELYLGEQHTPVQSTCRRIFKMDMQDIANSNVILADIRRDSGRGTGTAMELMFAHIKNKIIILSAIAHLIKGGAGQAVQHMNIRFSLNKNEGLK